MSNLNKNTKITLIIVLIAVALASFSIGYSVKKGVVNNGVVNDGVVNNAINDNELKSQYVKLSIDNAILRMWGIRTGSFVNKDFPNKYYFTYSLISDRMEISYASISTSTETQILNRDLFANAVYGDVGDRRVVYSREKKINDDKEIRIVGFDGSKLVFYETSSSDTPGVCASPWLLNRKYEYLDITDDESIPKSYVLSSKDRAVYQKDEAECIRINQ